MYCGSLGAPILVGSVLAPSSGVGTGMSSRMGHLEKEKLSPAGTCRMGSELAVCHSMASGRGMSGMLYLLAAGTSRLQWGYGTEPSSSLGGSSAQSHPGQYCCGSGVALPPRSAGSACSCAAGESRSRGAQSCRGGWQGRGQPGQGAGRKGLPQAGGAGQEAADVGVSVGASASCASLEPHGKEVRG